MNNPVAFVLLEGPVAPNAAALVDTLRQRHPDLLWDVSAHAAQTNADGPIIIRCGDHLVVIALMPAPIPYDENLWKRAAMIWPEGENAAGRHRAHLIVSTMGAAENPTKIESARLTTAVVGGLTAITTGCCAVVWGSKVARPPHVWLVMSREAFAPYPQYPFPLWVDIIPFPPGRTTGAMTVGLSSFVDREIEFEREGMDHATVIDRVAGLAAYLIERGGMIGDGDTVGVSETDRIKVHHRTSRFNGSPVFAVGSNSTPGRQQVYPVIPASIARNHPLLIMLGKAGLFDASSPENQIQLLPDAYVSEVRLESYDSGMNGVLSNILGTDAYVAADDKARRALALGDVEMAKSALMPFAEEIKKFQATAKYALIRGDLFMFQPR